MSKSKGKSKRLVYVPEDILEEVLDIARRRGESISKFVEETLKMTVKTSRIGYSPEKAAETIEVIQAQKILGGAFVPQDVLSYLVENSYKAEKEQIQAKWYESGKLQGKYLKEKFQNPVQALKTLLEVTRWDLNEVEAKQEGNTVKLRCISTTLTAEATELLAKFIEGAINGLGYQTQKTDCLKGMIIIEFKSL
ncbi:MAG: hypothetical protein QXY74_08170 [Candidatus Bathyarchaeia archaeon]